MGKKRQWTRRSRGFTTMELITVIIITMILTTIAVAGYRLYQRDLPIKYAADRLVRTLSTARSYAVANNSYYTVQFDRQYQNYWIDETDDAGTVLVPKVTAPDAVGEQARFAAFQIGGNAVDETVALVPVRFAPDGSCDDARITLQMGGGAATLYYDVRVYGPTGVGKVIANAAAPVATAANATVSSNTAAMTQAASPAQTSQAAATRPGRRAVNR
jgi:Tfp pilus assembly protein FimT